MWILPAAQQKKKSHLMLIVIGTLTVLCISVLNDLRGDAWTRWCCPCEFLAFWVISSAFEVLVWPVRVLCPAKHILHGLFPGCLNCRHQPKVFMTYIYMVLRAPPMICISLVLRCWWSVMWLLDPVNWINTRCWTCSQTGPEVSKQMGYCHI